MFLPMMPTQALQTQALCDYCGTQIIDAVANGEPSWSEKYCCKACEQLDQIAELKPESLAQIAPEVPRGLRFLENPESLKIYAQNGEGTEFVFRLQGLECASCVHLIEKLPLFYPQVQEATVDYSQSLLYLRLKSAAELDPANLRTPNLHPVSLGSLVAMLKEWGYAAVPLRRDELLLPQIRQENRKQLLRLTLTGAITGNIMMLTIPIYAGVEGPLKTFFLWLHFALFLPLLFFSALPFYLGAWNSLKVQSLSVDLPITIALWTGFLFSTFNLVRGIDDVYYDSTASFIFLILVTRYFVHRIQQNANNQRELSTFLPPESYKLLPAENSSEIPVEIPIEIPIETRIEKPIEISLEKVRPGQWLEINQEQILPADGILKSTKAEIDASLFSGESLPQIYTDGMKVFAGTKLISAKAKIQVTATQSETALGRILTDLAKEALKKNKFTQITDRLSQVLIAAVMVLAFAYFALNYRTHFQEAFHRALALIIIACPCALAFGTPLTFALGLRKARARGLLIKNAAVFEKMRRIKTVFLDKTGTVTRGHLHLVKSTPASIDPSIQALILSLETQSQHPLAFAFRQAWLHHQVPSSTSWEHLEEIPGLGVFGRKDGKRWSLKTSQDQENDGLVSVTLEEDDKILATFFFADEIQKDSSWVISQLRQRFTVNLLSGDRQSIVDSLGETCGIAPAQCFGASTPQSKRDIIEGHTTGTLMVGDGVNDVLAFRAADVSVAVRSSQLQNQNWADVICLREGIKPLLDLIEISDQTYRTLVANLSFAIFYNSVAGGLALGGFVNPLVAAILMPISSLCILAITMGGLR